MTSRFMGSYGGHRAFVGLAVTALLTLALIAPLIASPAGASAANGDRATIQLYTKVVARENALPALVEVTTGDYWFGFQSSSSTSWSLNWGFPRPPYPYEHAVALTSVMRVVGGHVRWYEDTFAPRCAVETSCTPTVTPFSIYAESGGDFWAVGGNGLAAPPSCWNAAVGTTGWIAKDFTVNFQNWYVGATPFTTVPHYLPMVKHGNQIVVTSTYEYRSNQEHVTEIDVINARTLLFTKSTYHVAATAKFAAYTYTTSVASAASVPTAPTANLC